MFGRVVNIKYVYDCQPLNKTLCLYCAPVGLACYENTLPDWKGSILTNRQYKPINSTAGHEKWTNNKIKYLTAYCLTLL